MLECSDKRMKSIHDPRYQKLIDQLIALREEKKITQTQLAEFLGKPQSYVAKIENFDRRLDIVELSDWLTACQTKPSEFIKHVEWWG